MSLKFLGTTTSKQDADLMESIRKVIRNWGNIPGIHTDAFTRIREQVRTVAQNDSSPVGRGATK